MRKATMGLIGLAMMVAAACGSSDSATDTTAAPDVTTTVATATTTTSAPSATEPATTEPPSPPTTAAVPTTVDAGFPTDAESYAEAFVAAWASGNHVRATQLGTTEAVDSIFAFEAGGEEGAPPPTWALQQCDGAAGSSYCTFSAGGDPTIIVRVMNEAASLGQAHAVSSVEVKSP